MKHNLLRRLYSKVFRRNHPGTLPETHRLISSMFKSQKTDRKIVYLDIGSNGGIPETMKWMIESAQASAIMIDMVEEWSKKDCSIKGDVSHVCAAMGKDDTSAVAYLTAYPACSSCLPPHEKVLKEYPVKQWFAVTSTIDIKLRRFDSVSREHQLPQPDIVKIDTQGTEYDVLIGMGDQLNKSICVEFECHMKQIYRDQKTFHQLHEFMSERNFILRDLKPQGPFEGEAVEFNSYWTKRPSNDWEQYVIDVWMLANDIWPGIYFTTKNDQSEKMKVHFN